MGEEGPWTSPCVSGESVGLCWQCPMDQVCNQGCSAHLPIGCACKGPWVPCGAAWGSPHTLHSGVGAALEGGKGGGCRAGGLEGQGLTGSSCWWWQLHSPQEQCWECWCWECWWCGAEQSRAECGSAPFPAQPRADCWHMTLVISPAQKRSAQGILMDL